MKTRKLKAVDDGKPGPVSRAVIAERLAKSVRGVALTFLEESLNEPAGTRRWRVRDLVTLLLSRAIDSEDEAAVQDLYEELKALRAAFEPAGRYGA